MVRGYLSVDLAQDLYCHYKIEIMSQLKEGMDKYLTGQHWNIEEERIGYFLFLGLDVSKLACLKMKLELQFHWF